MIQKMVVGLLVGALMGGGIVLPSAHANGQETEMDQALSALESAVQEDRSLSPALRQALRNLSRVMRAERREQAARPVAREDVRREVAAVMKERLKALKLSGDFRFRHETDSDRPGVDDRNRQRIRGRIGLTFDINKEWQVGTRLVTGNSEDPNSTHETLGRVFDSFEATFDRWYATYRPAGDKGFLPAWGKGLWLTAGKFSHPFKGNPVFSELVWDGDVNPTGGMVGYRRKNLTKYFKNFQLVAGGYSILEQSGADEATVFVTQGAGTVPLANKLSAKMAFGFYRYANLTPDGSSTVLADNAGNITIDRDADGTADDFSSNFEIINPMVHLTYADFPIPYTGLSVPLVFGGELIHNFSARKGEHDNGWAIGTALGSSKKKRDWKIAYQWQVVEQESVFSPFAQDDFLLRTNHRSHFVSLHYRPWNKIELRPWALFTSRDKGDDRTRSRFRFDVNVKF